MLSSVNTSLHHCYQRVSILLKSSHKRFNSKLSTYILISIRDIPHEIVQTELSFRIVHLQYPLLNDSFRGISTNELRGKNDEIQEKKRINK